MMKDNGFPQNHLQSVASDLKNFLDQKHISNEEVNDITLSSYTDLEKWEGIKEQITAALNNS